MRLSELIDQLEDIARQMEHDPEVALATQPNWPQAEEIQCVTNLATQCRICEYAVGEQHAEDCDRSGPIEAGYVWIGSNGMPPDPETRYAPREVWWGV